MADFSNRQLAEIITQVAEEMRKTALKQVKTANQMNEIDNKLSNQLNAFDNKLNQLGRTKIEPDLGNINKFYEEKTEENIKRLNSRLNVPNLRLYLFIGNCVLFFASAYFIWSSVKSKQEQYTEFYRELNKEKAIIDKREKELFDDMHQWFMKNPKTKDIFTDWRENKGK